MLRSVNSTVISAVVTVYVTSCSDFRPTVRLPFHVWTI